jgi:uncharacterized membrane protein YhhN
MKKQVDLLVYCMAILVFLVNIVRFVSYGLTGNTLPELFFGASILISIAAIIIRLVIVDLDAVSAAILGPHVGEVETKLNPARFFNFMPLAMISCTIADFVLRADFVWGMLTFLVAQLLYIRAYSGIIPLHPQFLLSVKFRSKTMGVALRWVVLSVFIYFLFLFNPDEGVTIAIIPYIITLCAMVVITNLLLIHYPERPLRFRLMLVSGGTSFFISDALLAIDRFATPIPVAELWIGTTYLLAVFLLQYSVLFLRKGF